MSKTGIHQREEVDRIRAFSPRGLLTTFILTPNDLTLLSSSVVVVVVLSLPPSRLLDMQAGEHRGVWTEGKGERAREWLLLGAYEKM